MPNDTPAPIGADALMRLVDAYAETRHTCGDASYNVKSKEARDAGRAALASAPQPHRDTHIYKGACPDDVSGRGSRDPDCPACRALASAAQPAVPPGYVLVPRGTLVSWRQCCAQSLSLRVEHEIAKLLAAAPSAAD